MAIAIVAAVSIAVLLWCQSPPSMWVFPAALIGFMIASFKSSESKCWAAQVLPEYVLLKGFGADHTIPYREIISVRRKMDSSKGEELVFRTGSGNFVLSSKVPAADFLIQDVRERIMPREPLIFEAQSYTPAVTVTIVLLLAIFAGVLIVGHGEAWSLSAWILIPLVLLIGYTASKQVNSVKINHSGLTLCTPGKETSVRWHEISKYTPPKKDKPGTLATEHGEFNLPGTLEGYDELSQIILSAVERVKELPPDSGAMLFIDPSAVHQKLLVAQRKR